MINPCVIWLTGLSGSGKTTVASSLEKSINGKVIVLDGDEIRSIFENTSFDKKSRISHNKKVAKLAALFESKGYIVIVSLISPYREGRLLCRLLCKKFYEVYVNTPLWICEDRDVKGLYKKARAREIDYFTGISDIYEEPLTPEITIMGHINTVEYSTEKIINHIVSNQ